MCPFYRPTCPVRGAYSLCGAPPHYPSEDTMAKGLDKKKEQKKKPAKTLKEKRSEKQEKKSNKS
jgi:hypothetical protein